MSATRLIHQWWLRRQPAEGGEIKLHQGRIYILPTGFGWLYGLLLLGLLIASQNYSASLGFLLTFLLTSVALVSLLHSFWNLNRLRAHVIAAEPVFAGETAEFKVVLHNLGNKTYLAINVSGTINHQQVAEIPAQEYRDTHLLVPSHSRGRLQASVVKIESRYPLGLVNAWSWLKPSCHSLVYPKPAEAGLALPFSAEQTLEGHNPSQDKEDFSSIRDYQAGDSPRQIAWRKLARSNHLLSKQYSGQAGVSIWLDWQVIADADVEAKLSQLCRWVLDAEAAGLRYGLRIPGNEYAPDRGDQHQKKCLTALACYGES